MSENDFEISRRKALAGIGVVGVASAGAGLGTTAYFSDEDSFDGNTITAGEFDLTVKPGNAVIDQDGGPDEGGVTDDGGAFYKGSIGVGDLKPGDSYEFCWEVTVDHNPGYVSMFADGVVPGDLAKHVNAWVTVNGNDPTTVWDDGTLEDLLNDLGSDGISLNEFADGQTREVCIHLEISTDVGNEIQGATTSWDLIFYAEQSRHNDPDLDHPNN